MSNQKQLIANSNPFCPIPVELKPQVSETDYAKDSDINIIEYKEVDHLVSVGEKDTDFVVRTDVEECSRVNRQEYISSYEVDVGILNIIDKVRRTGDASLFNQVSSPVIESHEKDSLGRPVQDIVDISPYQVDKLDALNSFKKGAISFKELPASLKGKLSMKEVAHLSDEEINQYLNAVKSEIISLREKGKETKDESSK